ncbi:hypothetical protein Knedl_CDS0012 [Pseudomonas phage Knedl]|nr:hypothetical protein Knedl_CDS0012 [Pseudomonas phage Knedl]
MATVHCMDSRPGQAYAWVTSGEAEVIYQVTFTNGQASVKVWHGYDVVAEQHEGVAA